MVRGPQEAEDSKEGGGSRSLCNIPCLGYPSKGVGTDPTALQAGAGSVIESWWTQKGWDLLTFIDL